MINAQNTIGWETISLLRFAGKCSEYLIYLITQNAWRLEVHKRGGLYHKSLDQNYFIQILG